MARIDPLPQAYSPRMMKLVILMNIILLMFIDVSSDPARSDAALPSFNDFSGVCQSHDANSLFPTAISWNRLDFDWARYEPNRGKYDEQYLKEFAEGVMKFKMQGVRILPVLAYNTGWSSVDGKKMSPLAVKHTGDWTRMVDRVVKFLRTPPYNVEYFQVWNEAHPRSGFWDGSLDDYMKRVHLPAANVIRANGAKVVYGGWPQLGDLSEFISLLDRYNAWETLDVLDIHYFSDVSSFQFLHDAAVSRGYPHMGIWQTEFGFETDCGYIADKYPKFLSWALKHDWSYPDRYKLFWYPSNAPDDPDAYGYKTGLYSGDHLSPIGQSLKTIGELLDMTGLHFYPATVSEGEVEGFAANERIVVAMHVEPRSASSAKLSLPKPPQPVARVERVDIMGTRQDITSQLSVTDQDIKIDVPTLVSEESASCKIDHTSGDGVSNFFVVVYLSSVR